MERTNLTIREIEVGSCLVSGLTAKETSRKLGISIYTVEDFQKKIKKKLKAKNTYQIGYILSAFL